MTCVLAFVQLAQTAVFCNGPDAHRGLYRGRNRPARIPVTGKVWSLSIRYGISPDGRRRGRERHRLMAADQDRMASPDGRRPGSDQPGRRRLGTPAAGLRRPPSTAQMGIYDKSVLISIRGGLPVHYVIETVYLPV